MPQRLAWRDTRCAACCIEAAAKCYFGNRSSLATAMHHTVSDLLPTACCTAQDLMYHLTGGNAREMRKFGTGLLY